MVTRRIYLVVLVALMATVLPLASIDLASAQDTDPPGESAGVPAPVGVNRAASTPPAPAVVEFGAPEWGEDGAVVAQIPEGADFSSDRVVPEGADVDGDGNVTWAVSAGAPSTVDIDGVAVPIDTALEARGDRFVPRAAPFGIEIPAEATPLDAVDVAPGGADEDASGGDEGGFVPASFTVAQADPDPTPTATPDPTPTPTPTPEPSLTPVPEPSPSATPEPEPTPSTDPTPSATPSPEPTPTPDPAATPEAEAEPVRVGVGRVEIASFVVDGDRFVLAAADGVSGVSGVVDETGREVGFVDVGAVGADVAVQATALGPKTTWTVDSRVELGDVVESLSVPAGWSARQVGSAVEILDDNGEVALLWAGGPVWDAKIAADYGFDADGELNTYTPAALAAIEAGAGDDAGLDPPSNALIAPSTVELVGVVDGVVSVRFVVDEAWLAATDRVWPISIDPTLSPNPSDGYYTLDAFPNNSYYWDTNDGLHVGTGSFGTEAWSYVKFDLSTIEDSDATINSATLRLYQDFANTCTAKLTRVSRLTESFDSSVSWNNPSAITTAEQVDEQSNHGRWGCSSDWVEIDVAAIVQDWSDGATNHGLRLEGSASSGTYKKYEDDPAPELVVSYTFAPVDQPDDAARIGDDPANRFQVGVNLATGDYQTSRTDVSIPTITGGLTFTRFLATGNDVANGFGPGWSHSYSMRLIEDTQSTDVFIVYPDGAWETHSHVSGDNYDPPDGVTAQLEGNPTSGWTLEFLSGVTWVFDGDGFATTITEPDGNDIDIAYDGSDQLEAVEDVASGRELRFTWASGRITEMESDHPDGVSADLVWRYAYNGNGEMTAACDPRNNALPLVQGTDTCEWFNWTSGLLTDIANFAGDTTHTFTYNGTGTRIRSVTQKPDGSTSNVTDIAYANTGSPTMTVTVTDANDNDWIYKFNAERRISSERAPGVSSGDATTYTYDGTSGMLTAIEDALESIGYDYDATRRLQETVDAAGNSWWLYRDGDGNVEYDCDARTNVSGITGIPTNDDYCIIQDFDSDRNMTSRSYPAPIPGNADYRVSESWTYTDGTGTPPEGLVESHTDTVGVTTEFTYNAAGDLTEEENQATGLRTVYTYDGWGRVLTVTEYADDHPSGITVATYTYTVLGAVATETGPSVTNGVSSAAHQRRVTTTYGTERQATQVDVTDLVGADSLRRTITTRDRFGRPISVTDPTSAVTTFDYDAVGNQAEVCDAESACTSYVYDAKNQLIEVVAVALNGGPDTTLATYGYDDVGQVEYEIDAEGRRVDYTRDALGRVTRAETAWTWTTPNANSKLYLVDRDFDEVGNVTEQRLGAGYDGATASSVDPAWVTHTSFDRASRPTRVYEDDDTTPTTNAERETDNDYNSIGLLDRVQIERDSTVLAETRYSYGTTGNTKGLLVSQSVENGTDDLVTTYDYDDRGLVVETVPPRGNASGATPANFATTTDYDVLRRPTAVTGPSVTIDTGTSTSTGQPSVDYGYNTFGERTHTTDPNNNTVVTVFDDAGRPDVVTYPTYSPPGGGSNITPTEGYVYDDVGRVTAFTDRRGYTTDFTYDDLGRTLTQTDPEGRVGDGRGVSTFTYDLLGNVESVTDPTGAITTYTYNDLYRRTSMTEKVRELNVSVGGGTHTVAQQDIVTDYTYDILGRPTGVSVPRVSGTAVWTTTTYDSLGYPASTTDPDGRTVDYDYDRLGRLQDVEDALGRATEYDYDMAGRQTVIRREDADADTAAETTFTYDADGNPTTVTDPLGNDTDYTYDVLGRLTAVDEPLASGTATTSYGYDAAGNMTRLVDANSNTTTYGYNVWNLPETTVEPSTTAHPNATDRTFTTVYDGGGLPTTQIQPGPVTVTNIYDGLGRLYDQSSLSGGDREFTHDLVGRVLTVSHPGTGDQEFFYDDRGLLAVAKGPAGDVTYDYDPAARLTGRDDTAGAHTYTWTPAGLLDTLSDPLTGLDADWTYNTAGDVTNIEYDNASTTFDRAFGYDAVGRLVEDTQTDTTGAVEARTRMAFDPRGDLTYETLDLPANSAAGGVSSYGYDPADRLTEWSRTDAPEVLLVVGSASSPDSSDDDLEARLEESFAANVTMRDDNSSQTIAGYDLVVVATSVLEADLGTKYGSGADIAVVNLAGHTWDEHDLTDAQATWSAAEREVIVADAAHPLAASLVGAEDATTTVRAMQHAPLADLGSGAEVAIHNDPTNSEALAFTYDTGATLADATAAPARRAAVGYGRYFGDYAIDVLSDEGWRLFDNAVAWALADPDTADVTTYTYDDVGNRTSVTLPDTTVETFTYDQRNRMLSDPDGDYTWTPRGTLLEFDDGTDQTVYAYNGLGELATVQTPTATVNYTYDGLGRLAERNGTSAEFEFAGFDTDPTYDGDSTYSRLPGGTLFAVDDGTDANLAVLNRHGDLQHLTDPANGNPDATQITDPWGVPVTTTGTNPDLGYQGDYTDPDTGLVNMETRWYDPDTGTFTSRDAFQGQDHNSPKKNNRYAYGAANPNKYWDPTGQFIAVPGFADSRACQDGNYNACKAACSQYDVSAACNKKAELDLLACGPFAGCVTTIWEETATNASTYRSPNATVQDICPNCGVYATSEQLADAEKFLIENPVPKPRTAAEEYCQYHSSSAARMTCEIDFNNQAARDAASAIDYSSFTQSAKWLADADYSSFTTDAAQAASDRERAIAGATARGQGEAFYYNLVRADTARQANEAGVTDWDQLVEWYDGNVSASDINAACNNNLYGESFQNWACDLQQTGNWKPLQTKCSGSWTCNAAVQFIDDYGATLATVAAGGICIAASAGACAGVVGAALFARSLDATVDSLRAGQGVPVASILVDTSITVSTLTLGTLPLAVAKNPYPAFTSVAFGGVRSSSAALGAGTFLTVTVPPTLACLSVSETSDSPVC